MLNDALKIGLDPLFMPPPNFFDKLKKFHFFETFTTENQFELVFDSKNEKDLEIMKSLKEKI